MNRQGGNIIIIILIIGSLFFFFGGDEDENYRSDDNGFFDSSETIYREDAISDYWDEIKEYVNGTETIVACSSQSGNCYDLDADIYQGMVDQVYFSNGGYLYFGADFDSNGYASEYDQNGNAWDFELDMDSSIVEDALYEWASDNSYELE